MHLKFETWNDRVLCRLIESISMKRTNETKRLKTSKIVVYFTQDENGTEIGLNDNDGAKRITLIENINAYGQILLCVMWCENNSQIAVINKTLCYAAMHRMHTKNTKYWKSWREKKKDKLIFRPVPDIIVNNSNVNEVSGWTLFFSSASFGSNDDSLISIFVWLLKKTLHQREAAL